jgi:hypothetical protein
MVAKLQVRSEPFSMHYSGGTWAERSSYGISLCIEVGERHSRSAEQVRFFGEETGVLAAILAHVLLRVVDVAIRRPDTQHRDSRSLGVLNDATVHDSVLM